MPELGGADVPSGDQRRTYRLACAATGEYTAFHGGTVNAGQAAIVTAINRVTGVYETELSIRMVLVANNNLIVYTNAATDPYSNDDGGTMLGQNQTTLTTVIGAANFDIGHVFSTGGGGIAFLNAVCSATNKARGVTGLSQPTGDPFYIDYVSHEMGHQFGGNHTFNSPSGSCSGNRASAAAYEPGSASTIMGYAGICDADDLQPNSDPYFVHKSYDEIRAFVTSGGGATCGTLAATGNNWPTVNAGASYTIPRSTPFALTATGSDPNNDPVTYCWEQRNLGVATTLAAGDNGSSPIIRSRIGTTNPTRTIPRLSNLLNNTFALGEILPTTNRTLNFRVTARDNRAGGGGVNTSDMSVAVTTSSGPFLVTSPNTNVSWSGAQTVTWNVASTTAAPVSCANVSILLSTDGGNTFPTTLAASVPNTGSAGIVLPSVSTSLARIKVAAVGNIFFDISNTNFTIMGGAVPANNACASAIAVGNGATLFSTVGATTDGPAEPGCSFCCGESQINQDVWYRYTATCSGLATVGLCGATFDTKLAVYQGACPTGPGTALVCNDDFCGNPIRQSQLSWQAAAGQLYTIRIGGYQTNTGTGTMTIACNACYANCDGSSFPPILNVNDFLCFQNMYAAGNPAANCDGSTSAPILNVNDFLCFQNRYAQGCP
jgi:reprolysin-like metallo-peptidase family M12B